ncbi:unnamed protein product [Calypogeia fissa]
MEALQSSALAKNAANLAAQLALVESRGREESMGREKSESRASTGTAVSAAGDSIKNDSMPSSKATSQPRSGHTSPPKVDDSIAISQTITRTASRATTGHTSPARLDPDSISISTSLATSQITTGHTSSTKLEDTDHEESQAESFSQDPEDGDGNTTVNLTSGGVGEENFQPGVTLNNEEKVQFFYSVAKAVEAFEAKTTRTKKVPK